VPRRNIKKTSSAKTGVSNEILAVLMIIVAAFLALSLLATDLTGHVGRFASVILVGLLGRVGAVVTMICAMLTGVLALAGRKKATRRIHWFMVLVVAAVLLASALAVPAIRRDLPYSYNTPGGGGMVGGFLGNLMVSLVGEIGAWVVVVTAVLLGLLWVTGVSLVAVVRRLLGSLQGALSLARKQRRPAVATKTVALPPSPEGWSDITENEHIPEPTPLPKPQPVVLEELPAGKIEQLKLPLSDYQLPDLDLLNRALRTSVVRGSREEKDNIRTLEETLANFGVRAKVVEVTRGPTCTRYEMHLSPGTKVSKVTGLSNDLAMSLASEGVRIEAPIPGKAAIGIEVPNKARGSVFLRDVVESTEFNASTSPLTVALGKDIEGTTIIADLTQMPHLLIAGATGAGKSVCINTIISSVLYKAKPSEVKMMLIDPKVVELSLYNGIPHLIAPVLNHPKKAAHALKWATGEMEKRYALFAKAGVRDIARYNERALERNLDHMPYLLIVIDELADLMMVARADVEDAICRLAQMARAAGMHLVIGTQRPSTDVITGLIKANIPSRLSFTVSSATDSRVILDMSGAEKLLGRGDMLYLPVGQSKAKRVQGAFVSNREIEKIVDHVSAQAEAVYAPGLAALDDVDNSVPEGDSEQDDRFLDAVRVIVETGQASVSMLQRRMRLGYTRAARIVDQMEEAGIVGPSDGSRPRQINKSHALVKQLLDNNKG